jgi:4-hydroxy-tetrahydrodipicolinate reductase
MRTAIVGAGGRMGQTLLREIATAKDIELSGALDAPGHPLLGRDVGELVGLAPRGVHLGVDMLQVIAQSDAVIDFSTPAASVACAGLAAQTRIVHIIGTTGFSEADEKALGAAARHATLVRAGNFSLGVNLIALLTEKVARALDEDFDIEIVEMHHRAKTDAPSGTALLLGEAAARGRGSAPDKLRLAVRDGQTGPRQRGGIGFASLRGGTVVGDHSVIFAGEKERIELTHRAEDRAIFARGALAAARWAFNDGTGRGPGLFSMADVLGFSSKLS